MDLEQLHEQVQVDPYLKTIYANLLSNPSFSPGFSIVQSQLFFKNRLVIPSSSFLTSFYWVGMKLDIQKFVTHCEVCQKNKSSNLAPASLLQPLSIPTTIWDDISMDFIDGLPLSTSVDSILVVVDRLSKDGHFINLCHPFSASSVAVLFIHEIIRLHGFSVYWLRQR